jgi:glycosyltransferase involved in cell wall biosynthesis
MNVLLISQAYPPFPVVGALRARKVAEALRAQGHRVVVITQRLPQDRNELREDVPDLQIHTVPVGLQYRLRMIALRDRLRGRMGIDPAHDAHNDDDCGVPAAEDDASTAERSLFHRLLLALLWLPDDEQRFIWPAYRAARALLRRERIDMVYTTAPPFSTHLVGLLLRRRVRVRWVAEFRDPWTDQHGGHRAHGIAAVEAVHRWMERSCLQAADQVVAVTEGARTLLAQKLAVNDRSKFLLALNGIDALRAVPPVRRTGPFRILYAGSFYVNRDPGPVLVALGSLMKKRGLGADDILVDFIGDCRTYENKSVERMVSQNGLEAVVHFHDWMPYEEAQAMMLHADLLLLIARGQPLQVPNKLFDYLGMRIPILALVDEGGESDGMLRRVGGHYVIAGSVEQVVDPAAVEAALELALDGFSSAPRSPDSERILTEWLASHQMEQLVHAITA